MNFKCIKHKMGLDDSFEVFRESFAISKAENKPVKPKFLKPEIVKNNCRKLNMSQEIINKVVFAAKNIPDEPAVWAFADNCHRLLFKRGKTVDTKLWPMLPGFETKPWAEMFYVFVFLSGLDFIFKLNDSRGIERAVTLNTLNDLELWIREHRNRFGRFGLSEQGWLGKHFTGKLFSLGRLQFEPGKFKLNFHVYKNERGKIIILAGDQMKFRKDGQFNGTNNIFCNTPWKSTYSCSDLNIIGNPIDKRGNACEQKVTIKKNCFKEILCKENNICHVHIPASGPLRPDMCQQSFRRAKFFFKKHFNALNIKGFVCNSWLLDAQLADYLKSDSNIIQFQKNFSLFPIPCSDDKQTIGRVFGTLPADLNQVSQNNSLQKAIIAHMQAGKHWRLCGGVIVF